MVFRDIVGASIQEGDQVTFPLGLGNLVVAKIEKLETLVAEQNALPMAYLGFVISVPIAPTGLVSGVQKIPSQPSIVNETS